jgi:hypothetical protein
LVLANTFCNLSATVLPVPAGSSPNASCNSGPDNSPRLLSCSSKISNLPACSNVIVWFTKEASLASLTALTSPSIAASSAALAKSF